MRRKETFATTGPRIRLRVFGSFDFVDELLSDPDAIAKGYATGVPMGGELSAKGDAGPRFLIWAMRDANAGRLQRLQVIKGWVEGGEARERVFDVACSDGLEPNPSTYRCPDNGASVNLADCNVSDAGAGELKALWTDPAFDARQHAFYYVRALENPSCRWSTWDALRHNVAPNPDLPATIQERAWTSPIWHVPTDG